MAKDKRQNRHSIQKFVYLNHSVLAEVALESTRLDRSMTWLMRKAWLVAREQIKAMPSQVDES